MKDRPRIIFLSGSGVSAESGIPTFRGKDGLWKKHRPEELATAEAFEKNPELVWDWYTHRRRMIRAATPGKSHLALAQLEKTLPELALITQNVDGLHQAAGSKNVTEIHGNIHHVHCFECEREGMYDDSEKNEPLSLPRCRCGGIFRPSVVWFGEDLPTRALLQAQSLTEKAEVFISVGTSSLVYPAAGLSFDAKANGAIVVEINPEETPLSEVVDLKISAPSGPILEQLSKALGRGVLPLP